MADGIPLGEGSMKLEQQEVRMSIGEIICRSGRTGGAPGMYCEGAPIADRLADLCGADRR